MANQDLNVIKNRYIRYLWTKPAQEPALASLHLENLVKAESADCWYFQNIDYTCQKTTDRWDPAKHYFQLKTILAAGGEDRLKKDCTYREKIIGAFQFWVEKDFRNPNWWINEIGVPLHIADLLLLLEPYLPEHIRTGAIAIISRGNVSTNPKVGTWEGANRLWGMFNSVKYALITGEEAILRLAQNAICQELVYKTEHAAEGGIYPDGSFIQHGNRWYSGGYGRSFTYFLSQLIYMFQNTCYQFPLQELSVFLCHLLNGQRRMCHHGFFDYNAVGREIARPDGLELGILRESLQLLLQTSDLPRLEEIRAFYEDTQAGPYADSEEKTQHTTFYPGVSLLTHRKSGVYIGVKCLNKGQYGSDVCNGEGILCYNMSYGTSVCIMGRGDEYFNLNPLFDYACVPGTTAPWEDDTQLLVNRDFWSIRYENAFVTAVVQNEIGIISQFVHHDGISLWVSFFTFNGRLMALGTDIQDIKGRSLFTTVDQCWARDTAVFAGENRADNGAFSYYNLTPDTTFLVQQQEKTGSWNRNNLEMPDTPVEGFVFLAQIPVQTDAACYAYAVTPRGQSIGATVLQNNKQAQAILLENGTVMAVFHADTAVSLPDGTLLYGVAGQCIIQ